MSAPMASADPELAATPDSGCRSCGGPWPAEQLAYRLDDDTWATTCPTCGHRQPCSWVRR